jgi:flagellar protein FliO/FliZ
VDSLLLALRVIVALGVVIAAIWFVRRRTSSGGRTRQARKPISVVARQNLAPKVSVAVVDFGGKRFLLGVSEHGVTVLHDDVIEPDPVADIAPEPATTGSREFATTLKLAEKKVSRDPAIDAAFAGSSKLGTSKLAGSVLSAATWKQAWTAVRGGR